MPIRAYVWMPKTGHYGHASLEMSDGTYISWWPEKIPQKLKAVFGQSQPDLNVSLQNDIRDEDGQPDKTFILPDDLGLNETKIKEWWEGMKNEGKWNLLGNNCCAVLKKALCAGGLCVERQIVETPSAMADFFTYLVQRTGYAGPRKKKTY